MVSSIFCFVLLLFISSGQITTTNYTYLTHGKDWNISVCLTGGQQSPIDIYNYDITKYSSLHYFFAKYHSSMSTSSYLNVSLTIESNDSNLGYGTLLTVLPDSIGSKKAFQAQNIIFRAPAEHVFNGSRYPLEVQVYHKVHSFDFLIFLK